MKKRNLYERAALNAKKIKTTVTGRTIGGVIFFGRPLDHKFETKEFDGQMFTQEKTALEGMVTTVRCGEDNQKNGVIIYCPPQAGNVTRKGSRREMAKLAEQTGKMVIGFNYNSAPKSEQDLYNDCKETIQYFRDRFPGAFEKDMTIYGRSLGGAVAVHVAAEMHGKDGEIKPKVICDRSFSKLVYAAKSLPGIRKLFKDEKLQSPRGSSDHSDHHTITDAGWKMDAQKEAEKIGKGYLTIINVVNQNNEPDDGILGYRAQMTCAQHSEHTFQVKPSDFLLSQQNKDLHNASSDYMITNDNQSQTDITASAINSEGGNMPASDTTTSMPDRQIQYQHDNSVTFSPELFHEQYQNAPKMIKNDMLSRLTDSQKAEYKEFVQQQKTTEQGYAPGR